MAIKLVIFLMIHALVYLMISFTTWDISWVTTMGDLDPFERFTGISRWLILTLATSTILFIE